jgi:hypothetical protein
MKSTLDMAFHIGQTSEVAVVVIPTLANQDLPITSVVSIQVTRLGALSPGGSLRILLNFRSEKAPEVADGLANYTQLGSGPYLFARSGQATYARSSPLSMAAESMPSSILRLDARV